MLVGKTLRNRYKIIKKLGGGGFGDTYLAEDGDLPDHPLCVVKHLKPKVTDQVVLQLARRLFETEAKVLYRLGKDYDQIPQPLAHFEENGEFYLVQEFVEGYDLSQELSPGKRLSENEVVKLLQSILEVLVFVHQHNAVHRDIKPQNLMRRRKDGKIVLIDFGLVKEISTLTVNHQGQTSVTVPIGTPGYMPSEQSNGHPKLCSDVYAVGMIGIQALTGILPHKLQKDPNTLEVVWRKQARVSDTLADVLTTMVRYDFTKRYQSAAEALQALNPSLAQLPPSSSPVPVPTSPPWRILIGLGIVAVVIVAILNSIIKITIAPTESTPNSSPTVSSPESPLPESPSPVPSVQQQAVNFVIQPQFNQADSFFEGLAQVKIGDRQGFIDKSGNLVIQPQFGGTGKFSEGLAMVEIGGKFGYIDKSGKVVIKPQFDSADSFVQGLAAVEIGGKFGYIDNSGKRVIPLQFDEAGSFTYDGLANVKIGGVWNYIDKNGRRVIQKKLNGAGGFYEGLAAVKVEGLWGYIDKSGKIVIPAQFASAGRFSEGLANVKLGEEWGYIDKNGKIVVPAQFASAGRFSEGLANVKLDEKYGYIDKSGDIAINPEFDDAGNFSEALAAVKIGDEWGYISKPGN